MAMIDYGALCWKNGEAFGKRDDLFEDEKNTLGFEIEEFNYQYEYDGKVYDRKYTSGDQFLYIGNKKIIFGFYKTYIKICNYETKEVISFWDDEIYNKNIYRKKTFEVFGYKFTLKSLKPFKTLLFEMELDGDKYKVIFGYGIDPDWYTYPIPEIYHYNKKTVKMLNKLDHKNYKLKPERRERYRLHRY